MHIAEQASTVGTDAIQNIFSVLVRFKEDLIR